MTKLSIAEGPPFLAHLDEDVATLKTPAAYLKFATARLPQGQLIGIQADGHVHTQRYQQIWQQAGCLLNGLRRRDLVAGRTVIILFEQVEEIVPALWSCFMGGFVPIPIRFSSEQNPAQHTKLATVLALVDSPVIWTTGAIAHTLKSIPQLGSDAPIVFFEETAAPVPDYNLHAANPTDLAALFLSSGTTGNPKLVAFSAQAITHRLCGSLHGNPSDVFALYWLPLDHASAILKIANPDVQNKYFLPTDFFLQNPLCWLDALERYRITQTSMTNFGMALVSHAVAAAGDRHWDIRALNNLGIGAEAIVPDTYKAFIQALVPFGLNADRVYTGYGLTECGTVVGGKAAVSCSQGTDNLFAALGTPSAGYTIRIVDEQENITPIGESGLVEVKGPCTALGYYQNSAATEALFSADSWMKTGDVGFIEQGSLTITGREKDIIIINAKNYSCQQIEQVVEGIEGVEPAFAIACAIRRPSSPTDELAIFFTAALNEATNDVAPTHKQLINVYKAIQRELASQVSVNPNYVIPIEKSEIPRTSMGKVKRAALAKQLLAGRFAQRLEPLQALFEKNRQLSFVAPSTPTEVTIAAIWSEALGVRSISIHDNFFEIGGQSLIAAQIAEAVEQKIQVKIPLAAFLQAPTVQALSAMIDRDNLSGLWQPLVPIQPAGSRPILFCIHGGGANVLIYKDLSDYLGKKQPVYGIQSRGLERGNQQHQRTQKAAEDYIESIKSIQPQGPYYLAGLSNGGKIAFEMTQQLEQQGEMVALLALFDSYAPHSIRLLPPLLRLFSLIKYFFRYMLPTYLSRRLKRVRNSISTPMRPAQLRPAQLRPAQSSKANQAKNAHQKVLKDFPFPEKITVSNSQVSSSYVSFAYRFQLPFLEKGVKWLNLLLLKRSPWHFLCKEIKAEGIENAQVPTVQTSEGVDAKTSGIYWPSGQVNQIILFSAKEKPPGLFVDPLLGWQKLSAKEIEAYTVPGNHTSIMKSPLLAKVIEHCIDRPHRHQN